jgi:deazaflavin-dependent oxidoreductase (nitroreductase family)
MTTQRYYNRPTFVRRRMYDPFVKAVVMHTWWSGFSRNDSVQVLAVRGRKTGRLYEHPVGVCSYQGEKYIVSFYGDSEWARNLRAGTEAELRGRKATLPLKAIELGGEEKLEFLRFLLDRYPMIVRVWWKLNPKRATRQDLDLLADRYPIFRVGAAAAGSSA